MYVTTVLAHGAGPADGAWTAMATAAGLVVFVTAYIVGLARMGRGSVVRGFRRHGRLRVAASGMAVVALAVALLPPLDPAAEHLFVAHMTQHMLLVVIAAPLLAAAAVGLPFLLVAPLRLRSRLTRGQARFKATALGRWLGRPVVACALFVAVLWFWHLPAAYDAALRSEAIHIAEHLTFLGAAWLLWWHVVAPSAYRIRGPAAVLYLFATLLPSAALGAMLTFARSPLYAEQAERAAATGADPMTDQQLAGLIMWIPADVVYLAAILAVVFTWVIGPSGRRASRRNGWAGDSRRAFAAHEEVSR